MLLNLAKSAGYPHVDEGTRQLDQAGKENFVEAKRLERGEESKIRRQILQTLNEAAEDEGNDPGDYVTKKVSRSNIFGPAVNNVIR